MWNSKRTKSKTIVDKYLDEITINSNLNSLLLLLVSFTFSVITTVVFWTSEFVCFWFVVFSLFVDFFSVIAIWYCCTFSWSSFSSHCFFFLLWMFKCGHIWNELCSTQARGVGLVKYRSLWWNTMRSQRVVMGFWNYPWNIVLILQGKVWKMW